VVKSDLDPEVLRRIDVDRLGEAERGLWIGKPVDFHDAVGRGDAGSARKEPGRHLDHDLLAHDEGRRRPEDQMGQEVPDAARIRIDRRRSLPP
jgi:hypothetical protein